MSKTIITKQHGPTTHRDAYMRASTSEGHYARVPMDYDQSGEVNHLAAAKALLVKLGWSGLWSSGVLNSKGDRVWVDTSRSYYLVVNPKPEVALLSII